MPDTPQTLVDGFVVSTAGPSFGAKTALLSDGNLLVVYIAETAEGGFRVLGQVLNPEGEKIGAEITFPFTFGGGEAEAIDLVALPGNQVAILADGDQNAGADGPSAQVFEIGADGSATALGEAVEIGEAGKNVVGLTITGHGEDGFISHSVDADQRNLGIHEQSGEGAVDGALDDPITTGRFTQLDSTRLANGNTVLLIDRADTTSHRDKLFFRIYAEDGTVVKADGALGNRNDANFDATVEALAGGGFVIAYAEDDGDRDIHLQIFDEAGVATTPLLLAGLNASGHNNHTQPAVAALEDGGFIVFYVKDNGADQVRGQRFDGEGNKVGEDFRVADEKGTDLSATTLADGRVAITYTETGTGEAQVKTEILTLDEAFVAPIATTPETLIDDFVVNTTGSANEPKTVMLSNGNLLVAYSTETGDAEHHIRGQVFNPSGEPVGDEILFAFPHAINVSQFDIAALPGNQVAIVTETVGRSAHVMGRRFRVDDDGEARLAGGEFAEFDVPPASLIPHDAHYINPAVAGLDANSYRVILIDDQRRGEIDLLFDGMDGRTQTVSGTNDEGIIELDSYRGRNESTVEADTLGNGNIVMVLDADGNGGRQGLLHYRILRPDGSTVKAGQTGNADEHTHDATVTALKGGGFVIAWAEVNRFHGPTSEKDTDIYFRVYDANGNPTTGRILHADGNANDNNNEPAIAALEDGGFILFYDKDRGAKAIRGQRFDSEGNKVGDDFLVFAGNAGQVDATLLPDGRVAVTFKQGGNIRVEILSVNPNVIRGTDDADTLIGGEGDELIVGLDGDDDIAGGDGNDVLEGSAGDDTIAGDAGNDLVRAGVGSDQVDGGDGDDTLNGNGGNDTLAGGAGNDVIAGNSGADSIEGGDGDDTLDGGEENDTLKGGEGADRLFGDNGNDRFEGGAGADTLDGGTGDDTLEGGDGDDQIFGGDGRDLIDGGSGNDDIDGGAGDDEIFGGSGNDDIDGGAGDDEIFGGIGIDSIDGGDGHDQIEGGIGDDTLDGGTGDDSIEGGAGNDEIDSGDGDDEVEGGDDNDSIDGGAGDDEIDGGAGNDQIDGGVGNDEIYGGAGNDQIDGGDGNDSIDGGAADDRIAGGAGDDEIFGGRGDDSIDGGAGDDLLTGGSGSDTFIFKDGDGSNEIRDFDAFDDNEVINLRELSGIADFTDLSENHMRQEGEDVVIDDGVSTKITLKAVNIADLDANDFIF